MSKQDPRKATAAGFAESQHELAVIEQCIVRVLADKRLIFRRAIGCKGCEKRWGGEVNQAVCIECGLVPLQEVKITPDNHSAVMAVLGKSSADKTYKNDGKKKYIFSFSCPHYSKLHAYWVGV